MQKKTIEIWMGFEIDADENWELSKQNIDNLVYAIKTGKYGLSTPRKIMVATEEDDVKISYTRELET